MILRPQRNFTIVRQIANHVDVATYYVQAVIRDSYTDAILDTLQLTARGGQRFSKNWQVPADSSGQGRDISIVTSVYSDSGYTTKSENYGDEENSYIIEDKNLGLGGGGSGVDSYDVRRIFKEELKAMAEAEDAAEAAEYSEPDEPEEPMRWDELLNAIHELKTALKPEVPEKLDLSPVLSAIDATMKAIEAKEVTEPTDLTPVHEKLEAANEKTDLSLDDLRTSLTDLGKNLQQTIASEVTKAINAIKFVSEVSFVPEPNEKHQEPKQESSFDINQLTQ